MQNNETVLAEELTDILQGTGMVTESIEEEYMPANVIIMPKSFRKIIENASIPKQDKIIDASTIPSTNTSLATLPMKITEPTLAEKANKALDLLLTTVQPYSPEDWRLAYEKLDYKQGKGKVESTIMNICISTELLDIAKKNTWYITHYLGDTYIFNSEFWVKIERGKVIHFLRDTAIKMGIPKYQANGAKFGKDLYEQVVYSGLLVDDVKSTDELLLNMGNGTLLITNNGINLRAFNHDDFLTYQLGFDYDSSVINQGWLDFLNDVLPDTDTQKTLQQALGSLLLRGLKLEKVILLYGTGANGKSVIFDVLNGLLGEESISQYSLNSLTDSKGYHRSYLKDKLINYASDIDLSKVDAGVFKTLASGEPIECRLPYEKPIIMKNYAKLIFNLNDISDAKIENTHGFYRRFRFIPFNETIPTHKQDKTLAKKLLQNKAGILNWILDGAREVMQTQEIYECPESKNFMLQFQNQQTPFEKFIATRNVVTDTVNTILSSKLYEEYESMCIKDAVKPLKQIGFSKQLDKQGFNRAPRSSDGIKWEVSITP